MHKPLTQSKRKLSARWLLATLMLFAGLSALLCQRSIRIAYHQRALNWNSTQIWGSISGGRPSIGRRIYNFQELNAWADYHRGHLVELDVLAHRLYLFPEIEATTPESNWLSEDFRAASAKSEHARYSKSGGTADPETGVRVRSVEIWTTPKALDYWDAWKAKVDATPIEQMRDEYLARHPEEKD